MAGSIGHSLLIQYYYGYGDSFGFYLGGNVITDMIQQDITSIKYLFYPAKEIVAAAKAMGFEENIPVTMPNDSNAMIMKITAVLSFFTFNKYLLISICFGFFSFIGIWKLFYVFYQLNSKQNVKLLAVFVLFLPSLWFWGSGLLKESICFGALGLLVESLYKVYKKRALARNWVLIVLSGYILVVVKSYIPALLLICFFIAGIVYLINKIKNTVFRLAVILIACTTTYIVINNSNFDTIMENFVDAAYTQIQTFQNNYQAVQGDDERSKATFMISDIKPSFEGMLLNAPSVLGSCLFRPFPWEAKKIIMVLASLEALLTLFITLFVIVKSKIFGFFKYIFTDVLILYCFLFSILFALVIGFTTFNFGTLVRYKIIFLPFYYFFLIQIYNKSKGRSL